MRPFDDNHDEHAELQQWFRDRGVQHASVIVHRGGDDIGIDDRWGFTAVYRDDHYRGWLELRNGVWQRITEPARHEVLATLHTWSIDR